MTARALAGLLATAISVLARAAAAEMAAPGATPDGGASEVGQFMPPPPDSPSPPASAPPPDVVVPPPAVLPPPRVTEVPDDGAPKLSWQDIVIVRSTPWDRPTPSAPMVSRWNASLYGFVELNAMRDSTQSYGPSSNNNMLARPGTYAGLHGRTQMTANNSLFGFILKAPLWAMMIASGHVELDFFGVPPTDTTEQTLYSTPSPRLRLFYLRLKQELGRGSGELLAGQYHDLFAWGGAGFYPNSVAFLGIAGQVYHRNPQLRATVSIPLCCVSIDIAAAAVRPVQRDSEVPDVQGGIKLAIDRWRGIGAQGFGQPDKQPLAIGVSGVWRRFAVAEFLPVPGEPKIAFGWGFAANAFVPIIRAPSLGDRRNALSVNAEFTTGTGISDLYTGLTGGALFPTLPNPSGMMPAPIYRPNIDPGIVTFDADGNLRTIDWRAAVVGLQYYLPFASGRIWVSANYSQLKSANIVALTPENSRGGVFYWQEYYDANVYASITPAVQLGLSYQHTHQIFGDRPFGRAHPESRNHRGELGLRFFF
jgi:hypothetical protein